MASPHQFLPHVNGLRGLAILAIFLYHLNAVLCPCGYFGVDIFLVISGFFLFRQDVPRLQNGQQSFWGFARRKLWRIVPPWVAVALPVALVCLLVMVHERNVTIACTMAATAFGFGNDYVAFSGSYFNPHVQQNPLMHLWYIGLTEQVYVLLPLLALAVLRGLGERALRPALAGVGVLSLLAFLFLAYGQLVPAWSDAVQELNEHWIRPYYSVVTRLWEPVLGALAAEWATGGGRGVSTGCVPAEGVSAEEAPQQVAGRYGRGGLALLGLAAVVVPMYGCEVGSFCVFPAALAAVALLLTGQGGLVGRLLAWRPLQWLGKVSFSLYLVHWPVFVLWQYTQLWQPDAWAQLGMAFLALLLAWLLWRLVESRCGLWQRDWSRRRRWLVVGIGVHVLIGAWGLCLWKLPFLDHVLPKAVPQSVSGFSHPYLFPPQDSTWSDFPNRAFPHGMRQLGDNDAAPVRFLLIGDSHAWHLCEGLHRACAAKGNLRGVYLDAALLPAWNCRISFLQGSAVWGREQGEGLLRWVAAHPEFEVVVVSVHWWLRLQPEPIRDWQGNPIPPEQFQAAVEAGLEETCRRLQALGRRVVLLLDTPKYVEGDPFEGVLMRTIFHQPMPWVGVSAQQHAHNTATERAMIARICAAVPGVQQYDLAEPLLIGGAYPFLDEQGRFLYRDTNHVSTHGSRRVSYPLLEFLLPLMAPEQAPLQKK